MGDVKFDSGGFHQITLGLIYSVNQKSITVIVLQLINILICPDFSGHFFMIKSVNGKSPIIPNDCYVAENATIVGDVTFGSQCSIWFNAVVRGDVHFIKIGNKVNIQDGAIIHCTYQKHPTIGNNVSIGHNAIVHGCTIKDNVLIGMGAIVMDNCVIESNSIIAAGSVVNSKHSCRIWDDLCWCSCKKVKEINQSDFAGEIDNF
jgi:carbonic anhydrase/acetyltransferase-like protein (isoleucine patch superfamily)